MLLIRCRAGHADDDGFLTPESGGLPSAHFWNDKGFRPYLPRFEREARALASVNHPNQVSRGGGSMARWRGDGKELFYVSRNGAVMAVAVGADVGAPVELFRSEAMLNDLDVSADGQRFLIATPTAGSSQALTVVLNWLKDVRGGQ